jgi:hypothetical protein
MARDKLQLVRRFKRIVISNSQLSMFGGLKHRGVPPGPCCRSGEHVSTGLRVVFSKHEGRSDRRRAWLVVAGLHY